MTIFDNTRPVNSPADDQSDVSEYTPNSEGISTSIPCTSTQGMIPTPHVEENTTSTSSRLSFLSANASVRRTRDSIVEDNTSSTSSRTRFLLANSAVRQTRDTSVQDNTSTTSSRMTSFPTNAALSGTRDTRPYIK